VPASACFFGGRRNGLSRPGRGPGSLPSRRCVRRALSCVSPRPVTSVARCESDGAPRRPHHSTLQPSCRDTRRAPESSDPGPAFSASEARRSSDRACRYYLLWQRSHTPRLSKRSSALSFVGSTPPELGSRTGPQIPPMFSMVASAQPDIVGVTTVRTVAGQATHVVLVVPLTTRKRERAAGTSSSGSAYVGPARQVA
jgi:hypothetical protein